MDNTETVTMLEWCAGYGGIGLGLKKVFGERLRCIAYCELEGFAQANLISKMEAGLLDVAPIWSDVKTFPSEEFHGLVDILVAGYPCQPFSAAGERKGADDPRHLWPYIRTAIDVIRPRMCFFENVEGHITLGLSTVISDLEELDFKVSWGIFSASEVGAPHQRKRVFIMAVSSGIGGASGISGLLAWEKGISGVTHDRSFEIWPARPGEQQHPWEPPRVLADTGRYGGERRGAVGEVRAGDAGEAGESETRYRSGEDETGERAQSELVRSGAEPAVGDIRGVERRTDNIRRSRQKEQTTDHDSAPSRWETEPKVGRDSARRLHGVDLSELSGLSHPELAEIYEWMVKCDNRTDELRLLGNGVVPATAAKAFTVLMNELYEQTTNTRDV